MRSMADCYLYGILDAGYVPWQQLERMTAQLLAGGIDALQFRAKSYDEAQIKAAAQSLLPLTREANVPLIINDHPRLAADLGADGAHVGQDDLPIGKARELASLEMDALQPPPLIGRSTHSLEQAVAAAREGADYIGFGPLLATPTKPDYAPIGLQDIARVHELVSIPIFCIGGIKLDNLAAVLAAGARRVVIVSGILQAADVAQYCRDVKTMLGHHNHPLSQ